MAERKHMDLFAPLSSLQWVERARLHANDYNPNKVSEENLRLLVQSILTNGWTLPIVCRPDLTIIDGFHRWTVPTRLSFFSRGRTESFPTGSPFRNSMEDTFSPS